MNLSISITELVILTDSAVCISAGNTKSFNTQISLLVSEGTVIILVYCCTYSRQEPGWLNSDEDYLD